MSPKNPLIAIACAAILGAPLIAASANHHAEQPVITVMAPRVEENPDTGLVGRDRMITASAVVYYGDLNLASEPGRNELNERVETAADEVCAWIEDVYPIERDITSESDCARNAVAEAEPKVEALILAYK